MKHVVCWVAICLFLASPAGAADEAERMPIVAWFGPPVEQTTPQRYEELADAGFTLVFTGHPNAESMKKALEVAQGAGVKLLLSIPDLEQKPEEVAKQFKGHPALGGYYLRDEPSAKDFDHLGKWCRRIQAVDKKHPCFVNLFPNYASPEQLGTATYQEHLDLFVKKVPTPMLSFDHYPVIGKTGEPATLRGEWYDNLERAAAVARREGRPLWAFALSVAHDPYPVAEMSHLRVQAFSNLAYGAQAIQYFTYWTPISETWNFHEAPIDAEGNRTPVYDRVKQMNVEIQNLSRVFLGSKVIAVAHTGETLPAGTKRYEPAAPVAALEVEGDGAVVSLLKKEGSRFLVIVNRDVNNPMPLNINFDGSKRISRIDKEGGAERLAVPIFQERVGPGDVVVLQWDE